MAVRSRASGFWGFDVDLPAADLRVELELHPEKNLWLSGARVCAFEAAPSGSSGREKGKKTWGFSAVRALRLPGAFEGAAGDRVGLSEHQPHDGRFEGAQKSLLVSILAKEPVGAFVFPRGGEGRERCALPEEEARAEKIAPQGESHS